MEDYLKARLKRLEIKIRNLEKNFSTKITRESFGKLENRKFNIR